MKHIRLSISFLLIWLALALSSAAHAQEAQPLVLVLTADGPVTASMSQYLQRGIQTAAARRAELLVFQLNTPGGSVTVMQDMVQAIRASQVPVLVYVTPRGASAASAGTVITLAGHVAAMAPETVIGAASPVGGQGEDIGETMERKLKEDLKSTVRALAERRPPAAIAFAEDTIENAKAATASEALSMGLIDFIAVDLDDLLRQVNEFTVTTAAGERALNTASALVQPLNPSLIELLLGFLTDPNIVFLLLTIGVQSILIEISSPGGWVAGFIGIVCLALTTYGLGILSVNWFGLVFLATAFVLFILDIKAPTHGALTAAGLGSLIIGALVLFNSPGTPSFQRVSVPLVLGSSLVTAAFFFTILTFALRAQKAPIRTGQELLVGRVGLVRSDLKPHGTVQIAGELWSASLAAGETPALKGVRVEVVAIEGIHLTVKNLADK